MIEELKTYIYLVGESNAYHQLVQKMKTNGNREDTDYDELSYQVQAIRYNGFETLKQYSAKLRSLCIILEADETVELNELKQLKANFYVDNNIVRHLKFTSISDDGYENMQVDFKAYIEEAYYSLLNLISKLEDDFNKLFTRDNERNLYDKKFVDGILREFNIIDSNGFSLLTEKTKNRLTPLLETLKGENIINPNLSYTEYMVRFWHYIKANGKAPAKAPKSKNNYEIDKKKYQKFIESNYKINRKFST